MAIGAPDHYIPLIPHTHYEEWHGSLTADQNPTYTVTIKAKSLTIYSSQDVTVKLNADTNDAISIKAHIPYHWTGFEVTAIYVTNTVAVDFIFVYVEGFS